MQKRTDHNRLLSFSVGTEEFAVDLLCVKEVIAVPEITPIPQTPAHFSGVTNLRGEVISIIDLRKKLGLSPRQSAETSAIICDLGGHSVGVIVDAIHAVVAPSPSEISPKPDFPSHRDTSYIQGIFQKDGKLVLILDLASALGTEDLGLAIASTHAHKRQVA